MVSLWLIGAGIGDQAPAPGFVAPGGESGANGLFDFEADARGIFCRDLDPVGVFVA